VRFGESARFRLVSGEMHRRVGERGGARLTYWDQFRLFTIAVYDI
jgi:hypothetical protein